MNTALRRAGTAVLAGLLISLAGCGSSSSSDGSATDGPTASVTITKPWARTSTKVAEAAAGYVTLESSSGDTLTGVAVESSIAGSASLHETVPVESDTTMAGSMDTDTTTAGAMGSDTTMAGAPMEMTMQPVSEIVLEAGKPLSLQPGGYHIMLEQLVKPLTTGQKFTIQLVFAKAGTKDVEFIVSDDAP